MDRPRIRDHKTYASYARAVYEYVEWRNEEGQHTPAHHEQDYPLVRSCPNCAGMTRIVFTSPLENPMWECMLYGAHDDVDRFYNREDFQ